MSDEIDQDLLKELGDLGIESPEGDGSLEPGGSGDAIGTAAGPSSKEGPSRVAGLAALLLGVIGALVMIVFGFASIRFGFSASDTVDRTMEPIEVSFDRMETRIDETDDLIGREGIDPDRIDELRARTDGLVDVSTAAHQGFEAIEDHPIYSLLPAELSTLGSNLADFEASAMTIDSRLGSANNGDQLSDGVTRAVSDELDDMQSRVSGGRELFLDAASSLKRWIRIGSLLGLIGSLWGLWGQISLAKRGWRGFRGRQA